MFSLGERKAGGVARTKFFRFLKILVFWDLGGIL
jgi:hypothetical protein